jgi:pyroglutamyl-peptidase
MENQNVLVTGFGKFNGILDNPSKKIIEALMKEETLSKDKLKIGNKTMHLDIFETSVEATSNYISSNNIIYDMIIHIGVCGSGDCIKLEQIAYNNMTFRVPDESNYQPNKVVICDNNEMRLDYALNTSFDVHLLCEQLHTNGLTNVKVSSDPGRFLCNYVYFKSLNFQKNNNMKMNSLFVHVPKEEIISIDQQIDYIKKLLELVV